MVVQLLKVRHFNHNWLKWLSLFIRKSLLDFLLCRFGVAVGIFGIWIRGSWVWAIIRLNFEGYVCKVPSYFILLLDILLRSLTIFRFFFLLEYSSRGKKIFHSQSQKIWTWLYCPGNGGGICRHSHIDFHLTLPFQLWCSMVKVILFTLSAPKTSAWRKGRGKLWLWRAGWGGEKESNCH